LKKKVSNYTVYTTDNTVSKEKGDLGWDGTGRDRTGPERMEVRLSRVGLGWVGSGRVGLDRIGSGHYRTVPKLRFLELTGLGLNWAYNVSIADTWWEWAGLSQFSRQ